MFKLNYRKDRMCFATEYFEDTVKNSNEKNEKCLSNAACQFQKLCFKINTLTIFITCFY